MKQTIATIVCSLCCCIAAAQTYSYEALRDSALQRNISVRNARLGIQQAEEQRREAFTHFFPQVNATGVWMNADKGMMNMEVSPSDLIPARLQPVLAEVLPAEALAALGSPFGMSMMKGVTMAGINAVQPIFAGGQIVNGNKLARLGEDASRLQLQMSENDVEKQMAQYYWQLVSLKEKQRTLDLARQTLDTIYRDVTLAVEAGLILRNDLLQVQLRQNELQSRQLQLDNGTEVLKMVVAQFCGLQGDSCVAFDVEEPNWELVLPALPAPPGEGEGISRLPEYQLLEMQVKAADLQRRMEVGKNLPILAVGAGYHDYHMPPSDLAGIRFVDNDRSFGMLFATLSIPISNWWGGSHAIRRKRLATQQAREQLEDNAQLLDIRRQRAWRDVQEAYAQLALAERSTEQAQENLRVQRDCYNAGTITISDLLQAQLMHQQTLDNRTDARAALQQKLTEYRIVGY